MSHNLVDAFHFADWDDIDARGAGMSDTEKYGLIVEWAGRARGKNPNAFDALSEWILDDLEWSDEKLAGNEQILIRGVIARFKEQNSKLRAYLHLLEPSGVVNAPVFNALDRFDRELAGSTFNDNMRDAVANMYAGFDVMRERGVREMVAGSKTGPEGTYSVDLFGYVNMLKDCDAGVQWTLFMPDVVRKQQDGFKVESFEYKKLPAMRFIGRESFDHHDEEARGTYFKTLDAMVEYKSGFDYDVLFMHHYGLGVDVERWHGFWGRFMKAGAPAPEGFEYFDFIPQSDGKAGAPYCSQFAYATFSGDSEAMHKREGYDSDAMYDVTRNIILGQGVNIPYPDKYWTAEVFTGGFDKPGDAYMFSAIP